MTPPEGMRTITLTDIPVRTFWQLQRHQDEMLREFALIDADREQGGAAEVPARLLEIVTDLRSRFASPRNDLLEQLSEAAARGDERVTVTITVPAAAASAVAAMRDAYEEADEFCRSGDLLTLAAQPDVAAFRRAFAHEILAQLGA